MNPQNNREDLENWLRVNTAMRESTIKKYGDIVSQFWKRNAVLTTETANQYITEAVRGKNGYATKYALRALFLSLNRKDELPYLRKVKLQQRKRKVHHEDEVTLKRIIAGIDNEEDRDIGELQAATGARARAIIKIETDNVEVGQKIKILITEKGGKLVYIFLKERRFGSVIERYKNRPYMFLETTKKETEQELERMAVARYKRYWNALRKSADKLGKSGFSTHDIRRSVAQIWKKKKIDMRTIAKALSQAGDIRITDRYFDTEEAAIEDAMLGLQNDE